MLSDAVTRDVTRIKLDEMARLRARLTAGYDAAAQAAADAPSAPAKLRALYDGLRALRFADAALHPEVANLEGLLRLADAGSASPTLVGQWTRALERELEQGRRRVAVGHSVAVLLEEWASADEPTGPGGVPPTPEAAPWARVFDVPPAIDPGDLFARVLHRRPQPFGQLRAHLSGGFDAAMRARVRDEEVVAVMGHVRNEPYRPASARRAAGGVIGDAVAVRELAGALTILVERADAWDWPAAGVPLRPVWTRNKWRPFLDPDLITLAFLELVGLRAGVSLRQWIAASGWPRPAAALFPRDPGPTTLTQWTRDWHNRTADGFLFPQFPNSVHELVTRPPKGYAAAFGGGDGNTLTAAPARDEPDAMERMLAHVRAEIALRREFDSGSPVHVTQFDFKDFYASIPHTVIDAALYAWGVPATWRGLVMRFVAAPVRQADGTTRRVRRGVMLDHLLSDFAAEMVMMVMDQHVFVASEVRPLRVVDDLFLITPDPASAERSADAVGEFAAACGLATSDEKSGYAAIDGVSEGVPARPPRWGLLRLDSDGGWSADPAALEEARSWIASDARAAVSAHSAVDRVNGYASFLYRHLGARVDLGPGHLTHLSEQLANMRANLFGPGESLSAHVRARLEARGVELPEALEVWPVTAGGLGLVDPLLHLEALAKGRAALPEPVVPAVPFTAYSDGAYLWPAYAMGLARTLTPADPDESPAMTRLVADFIERGSEVGGRAQVSLGSYWKWVLQLHGPHLLELLGTFRFLLTELVPLQMILSRKAGRSSPDTWEPAGAARPAPRPTPPMGGGAGENIPF